MATDRLIDFDLDELKRMRKVYACPCDESTIESLMAEYATGIVMGFGIDSYFAAFEGVLRLSKREGDKR